MLGLVAAILRGVGVDHPLRQHDAVGVQHGDLAPAPQARVDRQDRLLVDGRLEQEAAQVAGEHVHGVAFGHLGEVAADFAIEAGQEQAIERVERGPGEEVGVRVPFERQLAQDGAFEVMPRHLELDLERAFLVAAIDRQDAMRRDVPHGLGILEIVAVFEALALGQTLALGRDHLARLPDGAADRLADDGELVDRLGEDVPHAFEDLLGRLQAVLGVDELGRGGVEVGEGLVAVPDPQGERFEPLFAGVAGLGLLLGLVGEIQVFEPLGVVGRLDGVAQIVGELALGLDGLEDGLLALGEVAEAADTRLDLPDRHLVQVAGPLFAIAGDERHRVALVEQLNDALDLDAADLQVLRDPSQVDGDRGFHGKRLD